MQTGSSKLRSRKVKSRILDVANLPVYQSYKEVEKAIAAGTYDVAKTQYRDPKSGCIFTYVLLKCAGDTEIVTGLYVIFAVIVRQNRQIIGATENQ